MSKTYVLDTNVVLHDPEAIFKFEENLVVIPIWVIEEIDQFKKELSEIGRNARQLARTLDDLREASGNSLQKGVKLKSGGELQIAVPDSTSATWNKPSSGAMDHAIMSTALKLQKEDPNRSVIFITMDSNLRIRADALGLHAQNYEGGRIVRDELYSGIITIECESGLVDSLGRRETVAVSEIKSDEEFFPNVGIVLKNASKPRHTALGRFDAANNCIVPLRIEKAGVWGVRPRNMEQYFALDMLLNPDIHLISLVGKAGTGKTLLAIAAGLQAVMDDGSFSRLLVSRPIFPLGRDVGFLPGTLEEKMNPWMQPIFDNLEFIFSQGHRRMSDHRDYQELLSSGVIQVEALTYIRGRSLPNQYLIVDEAQNLTPHEVKTVITRCGTNTKIILTGDPYQIDNPYVDAASNGLTIVAQAFKGETVSGHVTLQKGERSELAERATQLL